MITSEVFLGLGNDSLGFSLWFLLSFSVNHQFSFINMVHLIFLQVHGSSNFQLLLSPLVESLVLQEPGPHRVKPLAEFFIWLAPHVWFAYWWHIILTTNFWFLFCKWLYFTLLSCILCPKLGEFGLSFCRIYVVTKREFCYSFHSFIHLSCLCLQWQYFSPFMICVTF